MQVSQFAEYVDKYFTRIVGKIVELFNGKANEETYLHKSMLTEEYSPSLTWGSTELDHSVVAADVVALDSPLPLKKRDTIRNASGVLPKIGVKYRKGEALINDINLTQARGADEATIVSKIFDDTSKCIRSMDTTKEILFRRGLSTGELLVTEDDNDGTGIRASFGYKADHTFRCTGKKWTEKGLTPQDDLQQLFDKAAEDGNTITDVYISKKYFDIFRRSDQGKLLASAYNSQIVTDASLLAVPGRQAFLDALNDEYGATFHVVTGTFKVQNYDGTEKVADAWKEANIVGTPGTIVGRLVYGTLAEETNPVQSVAYEKAGTHVLISKYSKTDPLEEYTTAQALCIPVIDNVDQIYLLEADQDAAIEVDPTSLSFTKSASSKTIAVTCDVDCSVSSDQTWATATISGKTVTVSATTNSGSTERKANITITNAYGAKIVVEAVQASA